MIAAINGFCLAAGAELVLGTDIRVAAEHAKFGFPEAKRAVIPFAGSMVRLPRQVAYAHGDGDDAHRRSRSMRSDSATASDS